MSAAAPWRAVLLAGGRSTRMGTDKALLHWGGTTLLQHMHDCLRAAGATQVLVSGHRPGLGGVPDRQPGTGPMGALAQLAPRLCDGAWVVVPVDMPLLEPTLLQALLEVPGDCAALQEHPLPLVLRLSPRSRAAIAAVGQAGGAGCSLRALQRRLAATYLPATPWQAQLRNCNTPADWAALRACAAAAMVTGSLPFAAVRPPAPAA